MGRQRYATFTVELLLDADGKVRRTSVSHVQSGAAVRWGGWREAPLLAFLVAGAGLERPTAGEPWLRLQATPVVIPTARVWQGSAATLPASLRFQVLGPGMQAACAGRLPVTIHVLSCELTAGQTAVLADARRRLRPGQQEYALTVDARLPTVGRHRLHAVVLAPDASAAAAAPGPILRVAEAGAAAGDDQPTGRTGSG